jgi:hypothetical protein
MIRRSALFVTLAATLLSSVLAVAREGINPSETRPGIKDYGLKPYLRLSKDLPHSEEVPWKLVCTLPYNCQFQPWIEFEAPAGKTLNFNSTNPLVQYLTPTESYTTTGGHGVAEAQRWVSGEGTVYTIPAGVAVKAVKYRETGYDTALVGSFVCNDDDYNILWQKAARTCYICMRDHFYDCPDRERVGFWGDGTPELDQCFYLFDAKSHRLCRELARRKLEPKFYPGQHLEFLGDYGLWFYYLHTGDLDTLRAVYEPTKTFLMETYKFGNAHTWFDWGKENKDTAVIEECFFYIDMQTLRKIALVTEHEADIPAIDARLNEIRANFDRKYWKGDYYMSSQVSSPDDRANAMAVNAGLADRSKWPAIYENVLTKKTYSSCFFDRWVFEALCTMGEEEYALLRMYNRYKTMIPCSFTTLWEHYDRWWASRIDAFDDASSLNHGWNPPALLLSQTIAGIAPDKPGWASYHVLPKEAFLKSIKVVVPSVKGDVSVEINKTATEYALRVISPQRTMATVGIPKKSFTKLRSIAVNGTPIWNGRFLSGVTGVSWVGEDEDYVKFEVVPGTWAFSAQGVLPAKSPKPLPPAKSNDSPLDKKSWTASASLPDGSFLFSGAKLPVDVAAANAIDGDHWTGWRDMTKTQYPGQWFQVDMKRPQTFDKIVLDNTWALWDSPRQYSVAVSLDGTDWSDPIATGAGELGITTIVFPQQTARFIRVMQTGRDAKYHWSIYEFDVYRKETSKEHALLEKSPISEPYNYLPAGRFTGPPVPESPDPLVAYRWPTPKAGDPLEIYVLRPKTVSADKADAFENLGSLTTNTPSGTVRSGGKIQLDFGVENGAWVEFDSPDCPGDVTMSISEYNEPGVGKTRAPVKHGHTYRLELNRELYDGVRFAWINVKAPVKPWHITGVRAVCQVKPTNYEGSFSCSDSLLTKAWYMSAYTVKASFCPDYFGSILMDRGDRMSWTGDAHTSQAAALVVFGNYDFIKKNLANTAGQSNGIRSYSLYWVLSLLDYYYYSGDTATMEKYVPNACKKLDAAYDDFGKNRPLRFYGWDDRLGAGFEIWFRKNEESQNAYKMLTLRVMRDYATAMKHLGRTDFSEKYVRYAQAKMDELRKDARWHAGYGLHAAADAITTGLLLPQEQSAMLDREFSDRVNRLSLSPFNHYFILQAMARGGRYDDAILSVKDMWGGMINYGATTTFEVYRPSWNAEIGRNGAVPNSQSGIVSLCHPWGAGVAKWLSEVVLGIVPTSPGFKTFDICPHLGGSLTCVSGATPTPHGTIRADYNIHSGLCKVSVPAGTVARIGVPKIGKAITDIKLDWLSAWDPHNNLHEDAGNGRAYSDADFVYFPSVQPGDYAFHVVYEGTPPIYREPPEKYAASFLKLDSKTIGNWGGVYGKNGYILCNYDGGGKDRIVLPSYVESIDFFRAFPKAGRPDDTIWATATDDSRALSIDAKNAITRNAACISNNDQTMTVTIGVKGNKPYQVALYFVDWDDKGRRQAVEMMDAETLNLVAPVKVVDRYSSGKYLVFAYDRSAKFRFNKIRGDTVTLSGIFFDPALASNSASSN